MSYLKKIRAVIIIAGVYSKVMFELESCIESGKPILPETDSADLRFNLGRIHANTFRCRSSLI